MTNRWRWTETSLWAAAIALGTLGTARAREAERAYEGVVGRSLVTTRDPGLRYMADSARADSIVTALDAIDARNPFERFGAAERARVTTVTTGPVAFAVTPPHPPRPALGLRGVVGVEPGLRAVVDGVPGAEGGVLLAAGDTIRGLRVRRVTADTVVIQGADTVWRLTMRRTWQ